MTVPLVGIFYILHRSTIIDITIFISSFETGLIFIHKFQGLKKRLKELIPLKRDEVKEVRTKLGAKVLGNCTVEQVRSTLLAVARDARSFQK